MNDEYVNSLSQFDKELEAYVSSKLDDSHIFNLGKLGAILAAKKYASQTTMTWKDKR